MIEPNIRIVSVEILHDLVLRVRFSDRRSHEVDLGPFLRNSMFERERRYARPVLFKTYRLEGGRDLIWGDFDLCIPFAALRLNDLEVDIDGRKLMTVQASGRVRKRPLAKSSTRAAGKTTRKKGLRSRV